MSGNGWTCTAAECTHAGPVAAGAALPALAWNVTPELFNVPSVRLDASVANESDGEPSNDSAFADVSVIVAVDLTIDLAPDASPFQVGAREKVAAVVTNAGAEAVDGPITVTLSQSQSPQHQLVLSGDGWDCITLFGVSTCVHSGPLAAGAQLPPLVSTATMQGSDYSRRAPWEQRSPSRTTGIPGTTRPA